MTLLDADLVTRILREVSQEMVLPRFRHLSAEAVHRKGSPDSLEDVVTDVDHAVESALEQRLEPLVPGAVFVGEEMAHARPEVLDVVDGESTFWVVDPIDGTQNFVEGREGFGIMIALVVDGRARAAWIHLPVNDKTFVAEQGAGAFVGATRLRGRIAGAKPTGSLYTGFMPSEHQHQVLRRAEENTQVIPPSLAAAVEYTQLASGEKDFVVYHRLHPWDHLPGGLIVSEAGGEVRLANGQAYGPRDRVGPCLAVAHAQSWRAIKRALWG